jgi:hypothetical protein
MAIQAAMTRAQKRTVNMLMCMQSHAPGRLRVAPASRGGRNSFPGAYCAAGPAWSVPLMFLSSS